MLKIDNPPVFRNNIKNKLSEILKNKEFGTNLEKGIFNKTLQIADEKQIVKKWENIYFTQLYINKLRSIFINLKNEQVIALIQNKNIKAHELAFMTHQEMMPEKWNPIIEDLKIKNKNKYVPKLEASSDNFTCWKCKIQKMHSLPVTNTISG